jgi:hypothetical protein
LDPLALENPWKRALGKVTKDGVDWDLERFFTLGFSWMFIVIMIRYV